MQNVRFNKAEIPLVLLLLPFIAGLGFAVTFPCGAYLTCLQWAFLVLLATFIGFNLAYRPLHIYNFKWAGGLLINLLLLLSGVICIEMHREFNYPNHFSKSKPAYLIARINNEPKLAAGIVRFTVIVEQAGSQTTINPVTGNLIISVKTDSIYKNTLAYGDRLLLPSNFTPIEPPLNPAEFNYKAYLAHQNIYQQTFLGQKQVFVLQRDEGNMLISHALKLRRHLIEKLKVNIRDTDALAVASTMLLGYRADLRKEVQQAYSKTGTMHLLAVSGMHVGFVYLLISLLLAFLPNKRYVKLIKIVLSILLIWCYTLITGLAPAVCRATLMLSMVIMGSAFNRYINRLNLLAVSAFILLLYNPFSITDAGFQLSYLAVFGIIILQPIIYQWLNFKIGLAKRLWMICSISIAAQIVLFPVSAFYFHDFPVYFLVSNLLVIIPSAIVMFAGVFYLILPQIPVISAALCWLIENTIKLMTGTLTAIENAPLGSINKIWLNPTESILIYGLMISLFYSIVQQNKKWLKLSFMLFMLIAISLSIKRYQAMNSRDITFFSLRKNPGILFRNGDRAVLLSDLKPTDKSYQYSIQPYLDSCKITDLQSIDLDKEIKNDFIIKQQNLIQFGKQRLLILDKAALGKLFAGKLNLDYIYITGSPHIDLGSITQKYNFKTLILSNQNSGYLSEQLKQEAQVAKVDFKNLKRNNPAVIVSNQ